MIVMSYVKCSCDKIVMFNDQLNLWKFQNTVLCPGSEISKPQL